MYATNSGPPTSSKTSRQLTGATRDSKIPAGAVGVFLVRDYDTGSTHDFLIPLLSKQLSTQVSQGTSADPALHTRFEEFFVAVSKMRSKNESPLFLGMIDTALLTDLSIDPRNPRHEIRYSIRNGGQLTKLESMLPNIRTQKGKLRHANHRSLVLVVETTRSYLSTRYWYNPPESTPERIILSLGRFTGTVLGSEYGLERSMRNYSYLYCILQDTAHTQPRFGLFDEKSLPYGDQDTAEDGHSHPYTRDGFHEPIDEQDASHGNFYSDSGPRRNRHSEQHTRSFTNLDHLDVETPKETHPPHQPNPRGGVSGQQKSPRVTFRETRLSDQLQQKLSDRLDTRPSTHKEKHGTESGSEAFGPNPYTPITDDETQSQLSLAGVTQPPRKKGFAGKPSKQARSSQSEPQHKRRTVSSWVTGDFKTIYDAVVSGTRYANHKLQPNTRGATIRETLKDLEVFDNQTLAKIFSGDLWELIKVLDPKWLTDMLIIQRTFFMRPLSVTELIKLFSAVYSEQNMIPSLSTSIVELSEEAIFLAQVNDILGLSASDNFATPAFAI